VPFLYISQVWNERTDGLQAKAAILAHNYGKKGWIIGHELTHAFDPSGRKFDEHGKKNEGIKWSQEATEAYEEQVEQIKGLYLETINRNILDFDFEKLCSVSLSNINVYACLVCGKYFQGTCKHSNTLFWHVSTQCGAG
jgi:fatty-acid desaturase